MSDEKFHLLPINGVVTAVTTMEEADAAKQALIQAGFAEDKIGIHHGQTAEDYLDLDGSRHGFFAKMVRSYQTLAGPEAYMIAQAKAVLQYHRYLVSLKTNGHEEERLRASAAMSPHTTRTIFFCSRWTIIILKFGDNYAHEAEYEENFQTNTGDNLI